MSSTYAVTVQVWCQSPEEAVRRTIIPGSVREARVQDLANQIQSPPVVKVPSVEETVEDDEALPLD